MRKLKISGLFIILILLFQNSCFAGYKKGIHLGYVRGIGLNYTFYENGYTDDFLVDYYFGIFPYIDLAGGIYYKLKTLDESKLDSYSRLDLSLRLHAMFFTDMSTSGLPGIGIEPGLSIGSEEFRVEFGVITVYTNKISFLPNLGFIYKFEPGSFFDIHVPYLP